MWPPIRTYPISAKFFEHLKFSIFFLVFVKSINSFIRFTKCYFFLIGILPVESFVLAAQKYRQRAKSYCFVFSVIYSSKFVGGCDIFLTWLLVSVFLKSVDPSPVLTTVHVHRCSRFKSFSVVLTPPCVVVVLWHCRSLHFIY